MSSPSQKILLTHVSYSLQADVDQAAAADNGSTERVDPSTEKSIMSMADSLIERAQEVVNSGTVDDAFKECFVNELKTELTTLQEAVKSAESSASALEETLKSTKDQYVRLTADFENFRKRTTTERDSLKASVKGDTLTAMLPLIDNFELAKSQLKLETDGERKIDAAYQGLYKQMVELFRGLGLEAVAGAGQPFDPEVHEAILREPSNEVPDGTVLEEFRKGFKLGERLLRPAMVKVSYTEGEASQSQSQSQTESESQSEDDGQ